MHTRKCVSLSAGKPLLRNTLTTLSYLPKGSCSSFCTRFSNPSCVFWDPGTRLRRPIPLRSSAENLDLDLRHGTLSCAFSGEGRSSSEASLSSVPAGHSVGYGVVRL